MRQEIQSITLLLDELYTFYLPFDLNKLRLYIS